MCCHPGAHHGSTRTTGRQSWNLRYELGRLFTYATITTGFFLGYDEMTDWKGKSHRQGSEESKFERVNAEAERHDSMRKPEFV